jgi:hypothetical protein
MKYLTVDGELSGTGIRDTVRGGYIELEELNLSADLVSRIQTWLARYEHCFYVNFADDEEIANLDSEGMEIARAVQAFLKESKVDYYSSGHCKRYYLSVERKT